MNKKKIQSAAFINPRGAERNSQDLILQDVFPLLKDDIVLVGDDTEYVPHLGLLSIAALLNDEVEKVYIDEEYTPLDEIEEKLYGRGFDLVCLSAFNPQAKRAYEIADGYKETDAVVIMGGLHVSALPEEALRHVDAVFVGEAEDTFREFLNDYENGNIKRVYRSEKPVDLTRLSPPVFEIVPDFAMYNKVPLFATRGCPHTCDFCIFPSVYHSKFRHKTVGQVENEIRMVKRLHPAPFISFSDENMLADREYGKELCRRIKTLDVPWECYCDVGIAEDEELLRLIAESGCRLAQIGFETVDPENLKDVDPWKYKKAPDYEKAIEKIQSAGIPVMGMFIAGFDGDDTGIFKRLKRFIMKNRLAEIDFAILTPMPGTPLFDRLKKEGRITSEDWDRYTWTHVNFQPKGMSAKELQAGPLRLFRDFTAMAPKMAEKMEKGRGFSPCRPFHVKMMGKT